MFDVPDSEGFFLSIGKRNRGSELTDEDEECGKGHGSVTSDADNVMLNWSTKALSKN